MSNEKEFFICAIPCLKQNLCIKPIRNARHAGFNNSYTSTATSRTLGKMPLRSSRQPSQGLVAGTTPAPT
jgi:hypothetical protein